MQLLSVALAGLKCCGSSHDVRGLSVFSSVVSHSNSKGVEM